MFIDNMYNFNYDGVNRIKVQPNTAEQEIIIQFTDMTITEIYYLYPAKGN